MNSPKRPTRQTKRGLFFALRALFVVGAVLASANACLTPSIIFPDDEIRHCKNGEKDPNESDIDCGGDDCDGCALGRDCEADIDCEVNNCVDGKCKEPGCGDGAQNPGESDIDCGGVCGASCGIDQRCEKDSDCASGSCQARRCVDAQCDDSKQNNGETDVDCGGSRCGGTCEVGKRCESNSDCRQPDPEEGGDMGSAKCVADDDDVKRCELACPVRRGDCDQLAENGCETDTDNSTTHCGRCDQPCAPPHTKSAHCEVGMCFIDECADDYVNCEDDEPGCETNLNDDPDHCSSCENDCSDTNGKDSCDDGECSIECDDGFRDCDADVNPGKNGCEININTNVKHCGGCSTEDDDFVCPDDQENNIFAVCVDGECDQVDCSDSPGNAACDGDGECNDKLTTPKNCGGCGITCLVEHGTPACNDDGDEPACEIARCDNNYADCDDAVIDCEVDIRTDARHCGGCSDDGGVDCTAIVADSSKHVSDALCQRGSCLVVSCSPGYADCDLKPENGCEVDVTANDHCGGCLASDPNAGSGKDCEAVYPEATTVDCEAGSCVVDCPDGLCPNSSGQCTVALGTVQSCKACGQVCGASAGTSPVCDPSVGCQVAYPVEVVNTKTGFNNSGQNAPDLSITIDVGSGPSRGLVILATTSHMDTTAIRFGSETVVPVVSTRVPGHTGGVMIAFVNDATLGTAGTKTVTVTSTWGGKVVTLLELNNVAQTAARDTSLRTGSGCAANLTQLTDVSLPDSLVVAALHLQKDTELSGTPTDLTEVFDRFAGTEGQLTGLMGYKTGADTNATVGWNVAGSCWNYALATASFNPRMVTP